MLGVPSWNDTQILQFVFHCVLIVVSDFVVLGHKFLWRLAGVSARPVVRVFEIEMIIVRYSVFCATRHAMTWLAVVNQCFYSSDEKNAFGKERIVLQVHFLLSRLLRHPIHVLSVWERYGGMCAAGKSPSSKWTGYEIQARNHHSTSFFHCIGYQNIIHLEAVDRVLGELNCCLWLGYHWWVLFIE